MTSNKQLLPTVPCGIIGAFMLLILNATALAQPPDRVSLDAEFVSLDLRGNDSVFSGLTVTDGTVTVNAAEGTTINDGDGNGRWDLRRGLGIVFDTATLTADRGTLRFADGKLTEIELRGDPVTLDEPGDGESRQFRLAAGRIAYDGTQRLLRASDGVVLLSDGLEVKNCSWTYDLSDKTVEATAETTDKCTASVPINRAAAE
jgi:lipopolysaccharide export system protein LptA